MQEAASEPSAASGLSQLCFCTGAAPELATFSGGNTARSENSHRHWEATLGQQPPLTRGSRTGEDAPLAPGHLY